VTEPAIDPLEAKCQAQLDGRPGAVGEGPVTVLTIMAMSEVAPVV